MFVSSLSFGGVIQTRNWCCLWFEDGFGLVIVAVYEHGLESVNVFLSLWLKVLVGFITFVMNDDDLSCNWYVGSGSKTVFGGG
jgi:hypothetical protein